VFPDAQFNAALRRVLPRAQLGLIFRIGTRGRS